MKDSIRSDSNVLPGWLGLALRLSAAALVITGCCLAWYYQPLPDRAAASLDYLKESVFGGTLMMVMHRVAALAFTLSAIMALVRTILQPEGPVPKFRAAIVPLVLIIAAVFGIMTGHVLGIKGVGPALFGRHLGAAGTVIPSMYDYASQMFFRVFLIHTFVVTGVSAAMLVLLLGNRSRNRSTAGS